MARSNTITKALIALGFTVAGWDFHEVLIHLANGDALLAVLFTIVAMVLFGLSFVLMYQL